MTRPNTIAVETRGAIDILTLNRPAQLNAVTPEMIEELTGYFSALHDPANDTCRAPARQRIRDSLRRAELGSDAFAAPGKGDRNASSGCNRTIPAWCA